ncbi:hypothetical protein V1264_007630 [Littorina saxatilis]|uniref:G-protein coupled receptors family 1 profile domain-containing protein n=2 Tax=Littorina saxatilis TaxID=31220 RepID=A0AAN9AW03_9CAEN
MAPTTGESLGNGTGAINHQSLTKTQLYGLVAVLSVFSVVGTVGNAIAFYVFSVLKKQKLTSTIFILALAGTDFLTCIITIPFTITMECIDFEIKVDFFCKVYHFLNTTTVPFSAFVMVVIAVDRYLCICHPFLHWMTQRRAKIIIASLALFIFCVGGTICVQFSIYKEELVYPPDLDLVAEDKSTTLSYSDMSHAPNTSAVMLEVKKSLSVEPEIVVLKSQCDRRKNTINETFFNALQQIYSSFFLVSCVAVLVLYSLIYHSVVTQRRKKLKIRSANCCCFLWDSPGVANGEPSEVTAALELSHVNGDNTKIRPDDFTTAPTTAGGGGVGENAEGSHVPSNGSSRAPLSRTRIERMRMANIKTALMLFVVTLVFILSFLPSWLIALQIIQAPVMVFYMYFFYNVVNPFVYAFMNQNFRTELKKMFRCRK